MLRHQSAGDVGNLSGRPNPHFSCLCVSADKHVYAPGAFSRNLPGYVASPGSPRQVSVNGCASSDHTSSHILKLGGTWPWQSELYISLKWHTCHPKLCSICALFPEHFCITSTQGIQWGLHTPHDFVNWTCRHLLCKSHHTQKARKHGDRIAPSVAWTAWNTAVCVQQRAPSISLLLFVLD